MLEFTYAPLIGLIKNDRSSSHSSSSSQVTGAGRGSVVTLRGVELRGRRVGLDLRLLGSQAVLRFLRAVLLVGPHSVLLVGGGILAVARSFQGSVSDAGSLVTGGLSVR